MIKRIIFQIIMPVFGVINTNRRSRCSRCILKHFNSCEKLLEKVFTKHSKITERPFGQYGLR